VASRADLPRESRAELRRRNAKAAPERPTVVWGQPGSAAPVAPLTPILAMPADIAAPPDTEAPIASKTRRSRRSGVASDSPVVAPSAAATPVTPPAPMLNTVLSPAEPFDLLEPVLDDAPAIETTDFAATEPDAASPDAASAPTAAESDAFEAAARLFSFTGELPLQTAATDSAGPGPAPAHAVLRRSSGASFKRVTATSFSFGVMGLVGLMAVGLTTPAAAVARVGGTDLSTSIVAASSGELRGGDAIQAYVTPSDVESAAIDREETYATVTMAQVAADSGIANFSNFFINDPNSPIQWPFAVGVPISYGYGMRSGTLHEGVDFTPGEGAPIQAIADGVVRESTDSGGAYGVSIIIDHVIDGQLVSSHYAHMQYGSRQVEVGQQVTVGTVIGHTGNTGRSFGAHTHFEILINGTTTIDPIPWLREHAGG